MKLPNIYNDILTSRVMALALWLCLTCIIFPNTDIFMVSIKTHICQLTVSSCKIDLDNYIMQVKDLLQLLRSMPITELISDLFWQFKSIPCYYFNKAITDLEQHYYLSSEQGLTCRSLCAKVIEIWYIQEQAQQWDTPAPDDHNLQALFSTLVAHQQIIKTLLARSMESLSHSYSNHNNKDQSHQFKNVPHWIKDPQGPQYNAPV